MANIQPTFERIGVLGCGNMGGSLVKGMAQSENWNASDICVYDASTEVLEKFNSELGTSTCSSIQELGVNANVIILGVKPQIFPNVTEELDKVIQDGTVLISIMAGLTVEKIKSFFQKDVVVVRTMPNLPLSVSKGVTAVAIDGHAEEIIAGAEKIFTAVGTSVRVKEEQLDAVTGVSGSGPMYVFEFVDGMIQAGVAAGLDEKTSKDLALGTLNGAVGLLASSEESPEAWTKKVCSPGGTTLAALEQLNNRGFKDTVKEAIGAAIARSIELRG